MNLPVHVLWESARVHSGVSKVRSARARSSVLNNVTGALVPYTRKGN